MDSCISSKDNLVICIDRSSSTYERNISLQIYTTIYDFSKNIANKVDIACFDTQIRDPKYDVNQIELEDYANTFLKPLPPRPIPSEGRGTNLSVAIKFVTDRIIEKMNLPNNRRVVGIIFTDDESHLFKQNQIYLDAKKNCSTVNSIGGDLIIIQMLPLSNGISSNQIIKKFNLRPQQVITFTDNSPQSVEIYKICSRTLNLLNSKQSQQSFSASEYLFENINKEENINCLSSLNIVRKKIIKKIFGN